eukprot:950917-Alexandrium_andersonii.AAC.1
MSPRPRSRSRSSEPDDSSLEALAGGYDRVPDPKDPNSVVVVVTYVHEPEARESEPGGEGSSRRERV